MKDGKIAVVEDEAERVRLIYRRYLEEWCAVLLVEQPLLYRRGQIQERDPAGRAASDHGSRAI